MSLLKEIQKFSRCSLRLTDTVVKTADGQTLVESHDIGGNITVTRAENSGLGFVGDYKPDLQVGEILPGLLISSQDVAADLSLLHQYGVSHILNLSSHCPALFVEQFTYLCVDLLDTPSQRLRPYLPRCFSFIQMVLSAGGCVLVHCNAGVSRAAAVTIAYVMHSQHLHYQQACDLVKSKRPAVRPNEGFVTELKDLEEQLWDKAFESV